MFSAKNCNKRFDILSFLIFLCWLLLGASVLSTPLLILGPIASGLSMEEYLNTLYLDHFYIPSCIAGIIGIVAFCILYRHTIFDDAIGFKKKWWIYLILIAAATVLLYYANIAMEYIYSWLGVPDGQTSQNQQAIIDSLNGSMKPFVIIYTVILAPIFEEIVFRKLFYNALKKNTKLPVIVIVLIIAAIFAFIHVSDIESIKFFPVYFILSLGLTGVYAITKENIYASIGVHFLNNLIAILMILL